LNVLNLAEERLRLPGTVAESFLLAEGPSAGAPAEAFQPEEDPPIPDMWSQFDMTLYAGEREGTLQLVLVYNVDLFDASRMAEMLDQLASLLAQCLAEPDRPTSRHSLVTRAARSVLPDPRELLDDAWVGSVPSLFAAHARCTPERVAVSGPDETWTYAELEARSSQLAHRLREAGAAPGEVIAIYAARSPGLVWAILGILKSGAAFTLLDPAYPPARLLAQLRAARPVAVVEVGVAGEPPPELLLDRFDRCRERLPSLAEARREGFLARYPEQAPEIGLGPDDVAVIGFTSGSTGTPRGIVGRHGPLTHFLPWLTETFALGPDDRFSLLSGLAHDPLQRDVFTPLCLGATICVPAASDFDQGAALAAWAERERVSVAHLTPALGQLLAQAGDRPEEEVRIGTLRRAFFVGDILLEHDVARLRRVAPNVSCVNYYGATETQRAVGYFVVPNPERRERQAIPAGRGIRDVQLLVLNQAGGLCGIGELGEIHVRSPHLAAGYLGDPRLTAEKFIVNPETGLAADRIYRSGDTGRYLPDGNVAFAGRRDLQIKIRGFRIELSEIEAVIASCEEVRDAIVEAREDRPGDRRLVAYVVAKNGNLSPATLRDLVGQRLPGYMVPAHVVFLDALPVTPNGKVDRQALPTPRDAAGAAGGERTAPRTPLESEVAELWRELLALAAVDVHESFFSAGGHSLLSTELLARVRSRFDAEVSLARFFARPTVAGLSEAIEEARRAGATARRPIEPAPRSDYRIALGPKVRPIVPPSLRDKLLSVMRGGNGQ
jgi:amino acid adenylation domain-containing protein